MAQKSKFMLSCSTPDSRSDWSYGEEFFRMLQKKYPEFYPEFARLYEPINVPVTSNDYLRELWLESPFLMKSKKNKMSGFISLSQKRPSTLQMDFTNNNITKVNSINLFFDMNKILKPAFTYIHLNGVSEFPKNQGYLGGAAKHIFNLGITSRLYAEGIADLGWLTGFASPLIEQIADKIDKLPQNSYFWRDDIFYIQITDDINDVVNNYEEFNTKREEIKNIIGLNLFRVRLPTDIVLVGSNS